MIRVIKRYESRKLYDTEESRYVSLEDISQWVRDDQEVRVVDNTTSEDVTSQVLTQIILDEGKRGTSFLPSDLLHELVRAGEKAIEASEKVWSSGVEQFQGKVDRFIQSSVDRLGPVREAREEMNRLQARLVELEKTLEGIEDLGTPAPAAKTTARKPAAKKSGASKTRKAKPAAKSTAKKPATKKPAAKKPASRARKPVTS